METAAGWRSATSNGHPLKTIDPGDIETYGYENEIC